MKNLAAVAGGVVVVGVAAGIYLLIEYSRPEPPPQVKEIIVEVVDKDGVLTGAMFDLGPLVINLGSSGTYLKTNVVVELLEFEIPEASEGQKRIFRDAVLSKLSSETPSSILRPSAKSDLRKELIISLNENAPFEYEVADVFFTSFVVQ